MKVARNLPETISGNFVIYGGIAEGAIRAPVVIQSRKPVDPHEDAESQVSLELICCYLVLISIFFISHDLFSIQVSLFGDGVRERWVNMSSKTLEGDSGTSTVGPTGDIRLLMETELSTDDQ